MLRVFDGCTELGSETQAFRDRGHEVITLGIEGDVTIKCDIRQYYPSVHDKYDFMWFSPPCTEFSLAMRNPVPCETRKPDLSIVEACFRIIKTCKPRYWIIENPRACLRHFIGKPVITVRYSDYGGRTVKPTDLWGRFPWFFSEGFNSRPIQWKDATRNPRDRAVVPYGLSIAICKALEREYSVL